MSMQLNDPRVPAWGNLKYIEKMRDFGKTPTQVPHFGNNNFVCRINVEGGHFGSTENDQNLMNGV